MRKIRQPRRGIALMLVLVVLAVTSVLGYAMLNSATLQVDISNSTGKAAQADTLAESGMDAAIYYLKNPANAPSLGTTPTTLTFGSSVSGSATVTVTPVSGVSNTYTITSVGKVASDATAVLSRSITANVQINTQYLINQATASNASLTIPGFANIAGSPMAVSSNSTIALSPGATVIGNVAVLGVSSIGSGATLTGTVLPAPAAEAAPSLPDINQYATYTFGGKSGSYANLSTLNLTSSTVLPTSSSNPGSVYYGNGQVTLNSNVTINGTLIVNGNLVVAGSNIHINPLSGMPALVILKKLTISGASRSMTVNGITWVESGINNSGSNTGSTMIFNGALLLDKGGISLPTFTGTFGVTYNSSYAQAPALSSANQTPVNVRILSWTPG